MYYDPRESNRLSLDDSPYNTGVLNIKIKKSDGTYTYFLPDIAYHKYKLERGFDYLVNILGADHHGYIKRMEAAICALGYKKEQIQIIIHQMVKLIKDGTELKLSKRTGKAYTLKDLCDEIGVNATRFQFASKNPGSHMELDIDLAVKQSNENPVSEEGEAEADALCMG